MKYEKRAVTHRALQLFLMVLFFRIVDNGVSFAEEKGNTPESGKAHQNVNNTADDSTLSSENPGDDIKTEKTDASPVKTADDQKNKRDSIEYHIRL